jgi:hypothetical protein
LYLDGGSASEYINRFQTYSRNLDGINNSEGKYSDHKKVQMFLKHIRDPNCKTTIAMIKNQTGEGSHRQKSQVHIGTHPGTKSPNANMNHSGVTRGWKEVLILTITLQQESLLALTNLNANYSDYQRPFN